MVSSDTLSAAPSAEEEVVAVAGEEEVEGDDDDPFMQAAIPKLTNASCYNASFNRNPNNQPNSTIRLRITLPLLRRRGEIRNVYKSSGVIVVVEATHVEPV